LFGAAKAAYSNMWWKSDEIGARAAAYAALSAESFCQKEPANCDRYVIGVYAYRPVPA
jgi:hypothetical protein